MKLSSVQILAVAAAVLLALPLAATSDPDYFPLDPGMSWSYEAITEEMETISVAGTRELLGTVTIVLDFSESTHNDSLENYWTTGVDGDVFLWGFYRDEEGGWGNGYDPPICMLDAPLFVGKTWSCTTMVYSMPEESARAILTLDFAVTWEGEVSVPAGDFQSFAIGYVGTTGYQNAAPRRNGFSVDGRARSSRPEPEATEWYSDGVGRTQYGMGTIYKLVSYGAAPVDASSWSRIKALYR